MRAIRLKSGRHPIRILDEVEDRLHVLFLVGDLLLKDLSLLLEIAEQTDHGQFVLDGAGRVLLWNRWMEAASDVKQEDALGLSLDEVFVGVLSGRLQTAVEKALEHGRGSLLSRAFNLHPMPLHDLKQPELPMPHSVSVTALSGKRESRYCLVEARDLTHVVQKEQTLRIQREQLSRANRALEESNRALHDFAHMASHDLKEPLRTITTYSEFLEEDLQERLNETAAYDLRTIVSAAKRMERLIQALLDLARAGNADPNFEEVPVDCCVDDALAALECRIEATKAIVTREELPILNVDRTLVATLYQNLIGNALKFPGEGPPRIHLTGESVDGEFILGVQDRGPGIEPDQQQRIFQPFKRGTGSKQVEGAGIGLAICQKVASSHLGRIWLESEPGQGCHFRFTLGEPVPVQKEELVGI